MRIVRWRSRVPLVVVVAVVVGVAVAVVRTRAPTDGDPGRTSWPDKFTDLPNADCACYGRHSHPGTAGYELHTGGVLRVQTTVDRSIRMYRGWPGSEDKLERICDVEHLGDGCYVDGPALVFNFYMRMPGMYERLVVPRGAPLLGNFDRDFDAVLRARREGEPDPSFDDTRRSYVVN